MWSVNQAFGNQAGNIAQCATEVHNIQIDIKDIVERNKRIQNFLSAECIVLKFVNSYLI